MALAHAMRNDPSDQGIHPEHQEVLDRAVKLIGEMKEAGFKFKDK